MRAYDERASEQSIQMERGAGVKALGQDTTMGEVQCVRSV